MAEAQTMTGNPNLARAKALISQFEDEHKHPRSGRLWVVLLVFTLLEIFWASSLAGLTDRSMKVDQFRLGQFSARDYAQVTEDRSTGKEASAYNSARALCAAILSERAHDLEVIKNQEIVADNPKKLEKFKPSELELTGRPGMRIYSLLSEKKDRDLIENFSNGSANAEGDMEELVKIINGLLNREELYHDKAFAALNVSPAVSAKLAGLRTTSGLNKGFFAFMGEASVDMLNRGLLEKAYPKQITAPPIPLLLILGLVGFAGIKMLVVAEFFMHVKYEEIWLRILMVPTCILAFVVIAFLAPDIGGVAMADWRWEFLLPLFLFIVGGFVLVKFLMKFHNIAEIEEEGASGH
jgi:hypothetical protein